MLALYLLVAAARSNTLEASMDCSRTPPVQLLAIDANGELFVPDAARSALNSACYATPFHVVSATGPLHSGKSFMLNALINSSDSSARFKVGTTVESETRGLWSAAPVGRNALDDSSVLFIDTEGLAASENTDQHGAHAPTPFAATSMRARARMVCFARGGICPAPPRPLTLCCRPPFCRPPSPLSSRVCTTGRREDFCDLDADLSAHDVQYDPEHRCRFDRES